MNIACESDIGIDTSTQITRPIDIARTYAGQFTSFSISPIVAGRLLSPSFLLLFTCPFHYLARMAKGFLSALKGVDAFGKVRVIARRV
jgi:hypothetical protein